MRLLGATLLPLAAVAVYAAGAGLAAAWSVPIVAACVVTAALHGAWLVPAILSGEAGALLCVCWPATLVLARAGLAALDPAAPALLASAMLEGICLLLALRIGPTHSLADRLAKWRRMRDDVLVQLRMGPGLLPWCRCCVRQLLHGSAEAPRGSEYARFAASLADTEHRLRVRLRRTAIPEHLRQSILESISAIVTKSEMAAAQRALDLERQALAAAAACREQCEQLEHLSTADRDSLADQCETFFLELTQPRIEEAKVHP